MAAGLSVGEDRIDDLRRALVSSCTLTQKDLTPVLKIDARVPLNYVSEELVEELKVLEPFGTANEKPLFALPHLKVTGISLIGKNRNVLKLRVTDGSGSSIEAVDFKDGAELYEFLLKEFGESALSSARSGYANPIDLALAFWPDVNEFRGHTTVQIIVEDWCRF